MSTALLVIDMQKGCFDKIAHKNQMMDAAATINEAVRLFKSKGLPVIYIQHLPVGGGPGSEAFEIMDEIEAGKDDVRVFKEYSSAFWKTDLDDILKGKNVEFVVLTGFAAEHCVLFTFNGARERGYNTSILQGGVSGYSLKEIEGLQLLRPVVSMNALKYFLK